MTSEPTVPSGLMPVSNKRRIRLRPLTLLLLPIGMLAFAALFANQSAANQLEGEVAEVIVYRSEVLNVSSNAQAPIAEISATPNMVAANPTPIPVTGTVTSDVRIDETVDLCRVRSAVDDQNVIVRAGPGQGYDTIVTLSPGHRVEVAASSHMGWFQVILPTGGVGWVAQNVVRKEGDCEGLRRYETPICTISNAIGSNVNIRSEPDLDGELVDVLPSDGVRLADMQTEDGWFRLQLDARAAWISQQVITLAGDCDALPLLPDESNISLNDVSMEMEEEAVCMVRSFTGDPVKLRIEPRLDADVIGELIEARPASERDKNGWFAVDGGWVFALDLRFEGPCSQLALE